MGNNALRQPRRRTYMCTNMHNQHEEKMERMLFVEPKEKYRKMK